MEPVLNKIIGKRMLGPVDISDWDFDEFDLEKAALRMAWINLEVSSSMRQSDDHVEALAARLRDGTPLTLSELHRLRAALPKEPRSP
jgi:hypothetical protein